MKTNKQKYALLLLVPYIAWLLLLDRIRPFWIPIVLALISILVPYLFRTFVKDKSVAILSSLLFTPLTMYLILYVLSRGDDEASAWLGLIAMMAIGVSAPIWILCTVVFSPKNINTDNQQTDKPHSENKL